MIVRSAHRCRLTLAVAAVVVACGGAASAQALGVRPDDRTGIRGAGMTSTDTRDAPAPRPDDNAGIRGVGTPRQAPSSGGGFHWIDAGLGAAGTLGVVLLASGTALIVLQRRRSGLTPT